MYDLIFRLTSDEVNGVDSPLKDRVMALIGANDRISTLAL